MWLAYNFSIKQCYSTIRIVISFFSLIFGSRGWFLSTLWRHTLYNFFSFLFHNYHTQEKFLHPILVFNGTRQRHPITVLDKALLFVHHNTELCGTLRIYTQWKTRKIALRMKLTPTLNRAGLSRVKIHKVWQAVYTEFYTVLNDRFYVIRVYMW